MSSGPFIFVMCLDLEINAGESFQHSLPGNVSNFKLTSKIWRRMKKREAFDSWNEDGLYLNRYYFLWVSLLIIFNGSPSSL